MDACGPLVVDSRLQMQAARQAVAAGNVAEAEARAMAIACHLIPDSPSQEDDIVEAVQIRLGVLVLAIAEQAIDPEGSLWPTLVEIQEVLGVDHSWAVATAAILAELARLE